MTFTVNDNLKTNAIIAASSNSIGTDGQVLQSNGSVIYWGSGVDVTWPGANSNIFFHDNGAISANTQLNWYHANSTFSASGEGASPRLLGAPLPPPSGGRGAYRRGPYPRSPRSSRR